jgi:hypothetical protein
MTATGRCGDESVIRRGKDTVCLLVHIGLIGTIKVKRGPRAGTPLIAGQFIPALRSCVVSWSRRFEEPIELPDGRELKTLAEAMAWLAKEVPKSEHKMEKCRPPPTASHAPPSAAGR